MSPIHTKKADKLDLGVNKFDALDNPDRCAGYPSREKRRSSLKSSTTTNEPIVVAATAFATEDLRRSRLPCEEDLGNAAPLSTSTMSSPLSHINTNRHKLTSPLQKALAFEGRCPQADAENRGGAAMRVAQRGIAPLTHNDPDDNTDISFTSTANAAPTLPVMDATPTKHDTDSNHVGPLRTLPFRSVSKVMTSLRAFFCKLRAMSMRQMMWVTLLVALVMVGNFMQIVMLNFWLISFPSDGTPGNYTAFAVPGIFFAIFFFLLLCAYVAIRRPSLRFARHAHGWTILLGVGFCDALNSWMATYAASYTSEVLQALFTNLCPLYAVFLCKWILRDTRRYANVYIASVFVLTICGILAASLYGLVKDHHMGDGNWWILIFFLSMPFRVLMNVWQSLYMIVYTRDPEFISWLRVRLGTASDFPENSTVATPDNSDTFAETDVVLSPDRASFPNSGFEKNISVITPGSVSAPIGEDGDNEVTEQAGLVNTDKLNYEEVDTTCPVTHGSVNATGDSVGIIATEICAPETTSCAASVSAHSPATLSREPLLSHEDMLYPLHPARENEDLRPTATAASLLPTDTMFTVRYNQCDDTIVKLVMLAGETTIQMCFTLCLLPADALPWWGNSDSVSSTWTNFIEGLNCVFTIRENFLYCFLYTLGFIFTYVGCAYLNHYSAALCSIVSQLSSPVTALLLVIVPSWNVQADGDSPWYLNSIAIIVLCVAALIYVMWEDMTDDEKVHAEYELKMRELHVRRSSHQAPHPVTIRG